jgi:hypothetical protein
MWGTLTDRGELYLFGLGSGVRRNFDPFRAADLLTSTKYLNNTYCHACHDCARLNRIYKMTEVETNGAGGLDLAATKKALASSSTTLRLAHLHTLEEKLVSNGLS